MPDYSDVRLDTRDITLLFSRIRANKQSGCWEWTGRLTHNGYAQAVFANVTHRVHRLVFAWLVAPLPDSNIHPFWQIDHLCRNRNCVNPAHLELVTAAENVQRAHRRYRKGEGIGRPCTNCCPQGHEFTPENTLTDRGHRRCRQCHREGSLASYYRRKSTRR